MEPRKPKPAPPEPPQVEGGETDQAAPQPAPEPKGGMIGEGDAGGGSPGGTNRDGGMLCQG